MLVGIVHVLRHTQSKKKYPWHSFYVYIDVSVNVRHMIISTYRCTGLAQR